nr:OmpP1/FadL family transporter [Mesorhizobium ephedrae]
MASVGSALAGGLERGGYNIDLLFDPSRFAADATAAYIMPQRELNNVVSANPLASGATDGVRDTEDYWVPRIGMKFGAAEAVDCMIDYSQPWGAHSAPGADWVGANNNIETKVNSDNYAATCSYRTDLGKGQIRFIGGAFYQEVDGFKERLVVVPTPIGIFTGNGRLELGGDGVGWRAGVAYEIEEIAFRASLVYNSEVDLGDITGTLDLTQLPPLNPILGRVTDVVGTASMPQSVELKVQSGIAPGWLAFGSVKWVDWSVLQSILFCPVGQPTCTPTNRATSLDLLYRDGWTVQAGIGHAFTDKLSGAASITWDRGTSTGLGTQTDTWLLSAGGSYTPNQNLEFRLGGSVGILTSGSSGVVESDGISYGTDVAYDFGDDLVSAVSGSVKLKF